MAAGADPAFEVAAIKLSDPGNQSSGFQLRGSRVIVLNETLQVMLMFAYGVQQRQIAGGPGWLATDHYDVSGFADAPGEPNVKQMQTMMRKLLRDRFSLQFHEEKREMPVYALRLGKGGPRLTDAAHPVADMADQTGNGGKTEDWRFTNNSVSDFAGFLQSKLDRPVLDETGLTGRYDFRLKWTPDPSKQTEADAAPGLFTALGEQIGLKLEPAREAAKVLVIDRMERPSAN